jgi:hypothetical protein
VAPLGVGDDNKQYLFYDVELGKRETISLTLNTPINQNDEVRVRSGNGEVSFNLFGTEQNAVTT